MEYVRLGPAGVETSALCLGTWMFGIEKDDETVMDRDDAHAVLDAAWDRGINFFDTANAYGSGNSERFIGEWLAGHDREDFVVASKVYWTTRGRRESGLSRKIVRAEIEGTLEDLDTDYVDIYYIHGWHEPSPLAETLSALNDLVREGKVHYVGVSNFTAWQLFLALWLCETNGWEAPVVIQPRFNALDHYPYTVDPSELPLPDLFDACRHQDIGVCSYGPLAGGFLSGKYERGTDGSVRGADGTRANLSDNFGPFDDRAWGVLEAIEAVAEDVDATPAQVALRWIMDLPGLTSIPVIGGRTVDQLQENVAAVDLSLTDDQYEQIQEAGAPSSSSWPIYVD